MDFLLHLLCTTVWSEAFASTSDEDERGDEKDQTISYHTLYRACSLLLFAIYSPNKNKCECVRRKKNPYINSFAVRRLPDVGTSIRDQQRIKTTVITTNNDERKERGWGEQMELLNDLI